MKTLLSLAVLSLFAAAPAVASSNPAAMTWEQLNDQSKMLDSQLTETQHRLEAIRQEKQRQEHELKEAKRALMAHEDGLDQLKKAPETTAEFFKGKSPAEIAAAFKKRKQDRVDLAQNKIRHLDAEREKYTDKMEKCETEKRAVAAALPKAQAERDTARALSRDIDAYVADYKSADATLAKQGLTEQDLSGARHKVTGLAPRLAALQDRAGKLTIPGYRDAANAALKPGLDTDRLLAALGKANNQAARNAKGGTGRNTR